MITIRDMVPADRAFIVDSWMLSSRAAGGDASSIGIQGILAYGGRCKVAVAEVDPTIIIGWACARSKTLEYVYVKKDARHNGIAKELVQALAPITRAGCTTWPWTQVYAEERFQL